MKVLFLGKPDDELVVWLKGQGEDVETAEDKIDLEFLNQVKPDMIVSYNYRNILGKELIDFPEKGAINLHISLLPYNRGADPNPWSFLENTPKGITIHMIDEGIDSGDILVQKEVKFDETKETLSTSYNKLHDEIKKLFKENWEDIKLGKIKAKKQEGNGSIHFKKDNIKFQKYLNEKGWETPVSELIDKGVNVK